MDGEVDRRLRLAGVEDAVAGDRVGQLKMENTLGHSIVDVTCSIPPTARSRQTRSRESFPPFGTWGSRTARGWVLSKHRRNTAQMGKKMVVRVVLHERNIFFGLIPTPARSAVMFECGDHNRRCRLDRPHHRGGKVPSDEPSRETGEVRRAACSASATARRAVPGSDCARARRRAERTTRIRPLGVAP